MCQEKLRNLVFVGLSIVLGTGAIKIPGLLEKRLGIYQIISWGISLVFCLISAHFISRIVVGKGFVNFLREEVGNSILLAYIFAYLVILSALSLALSKSISLVLKVNEKYMAMLILCLVYFFCFQKFIKKFQEIIAKVKVLMFALILILLFGGIKRINNVRINIADVFLSSSLTFWAFVGFECISFERGARGNIIKKAIMLILILSFLIYLPIIVFFSFSKHPPLETEAVEYLILQKGKIGILTFILIILAFFGSLTGIFYFLSEMLAHLKVRKIDAASIIFLISIILLWVGNFEILVEVSSTIIISVFLVTFPRIANNSKDKILLFFLIAMSSLISHYIPIIFPIIVLLVIAEHLFTPKGRAIVC